MEEKNVVLDVIIEMIKGLKTNDGAMETYVNGKVYKLWSCKYLLNQILRQWHLTDDKRYVSKKAYELFKQMQSGSIFDYHYTNSVKYEGEEPVEVQVYKGASNYNESETLYKGKIFKFNSVFHEEHIVPIKVIIENLCKLKELTYESVESVLDKIAICYMLKEEDKKLNKEHFKSNRPYEIKEVLDKIYKELGIEVFRKDSL